MNARRRRIALLGATGSIGTNALRVIRAHSDRLELVAIAGGSRVEPLAAIAREFGVRDVALFSPSTSGSNTTKASFPSGTRLRYGMEGLVEIATLDDVDMVLIAVVGTTALHACVEAIRNGKTIALASKEILVMAGEFIMPLVKEYGVALLPTDSEHNALYQCQKGESQRAIQKVILTASGGPYLNTPMADLGGITPAQAVCHPNWSMGPKISIDSATMANKGLEVIEARWLFDLTPDQVDVVVHPQSIVHSLVQFVDGSMLAQLSPPNMSFAIQHCLLYPERVSGIDAPLDLSQALNLEFTPPDLVRFPCLSLAYDALRAGGCAPAAFNAANEVAVSAFVENRISFLDIPRLIRFTLETMVSPPPSSLDDIIQADAEARRVSSHWIVS